MNDEQKIDLSNIIAEYIDEVNKVINYREKTGKIQKSICTECAKLGSCQNLQSISSIQDFRKDQICIAKRYVDLIKKYNISTIDGRDDLHIYAGKPLILKSKVGMEPYYDKLSKVYRYIFSKYEGRNTFEKPKWLNEMFFGCGVSGIRFCIHLSNDDSYETLLRNISILKKINQYMVKLDLNKYSPRGNYAWETVFDKYIYFCCHECKSNFNNNILNYYNCDDYRWHSIVLQNVLKSNNINYKIIGDFNDAFFINKNKEIINIGKTHSERLINKYHPSKLYFCGKRKDFLKLTRFGIDLFCIDGDKFYKWDANKKINVDVEIICNAIASNFFKYVM